MKLLKRISVLVMMIAVVAAFAGCGACGKLKATPRNCVCESQPSFCSTSAVPKMGNTYSIPPFSEL